MARVILTGSLRSLAGDESEIEIDAASVRELLRALEPRLPGIDKQVEDGLSIAIDGEIIQDPLLEPIGPDSEIHFLPPVSGGAC
ncbi:MAG: MoaD/ThiS family protein [Myxococcota bacterium]